MTARRAPALDGATAALVRLSAALSAGDEAALEAALDGALREADHAATEEALLQSYLFLGYPAALNGFARWRRRRPQPAGAPAPDDWEGWAARGEAVLERVYAGQYARLRENVRALHPDMERWMVAEGYGKVLARPGLGLRERELCIVALLAPRDADPQLYAHLRGALNAGASPAQVDEALGLATDGAQAGRRERAEAVWAEVRDRWARSRGGAARVESEEE